MESNPRSPWRPVATHLARNGMILGLVAAVALAWVLPEWGARGGPLRTGVTSKAAVFLIFLLQGLSLPTETLRRGLLAWRLHLVTQIAIFGILPVLAWLITLVMDRNLDPSLRMGFLYLGMLPTTIATAVALTAQAGGNTTGALFNTCVSNIAGVLLVPLGTTLWTRVSGEVAPVGRLLLEIAVLLLLPLVLGQLGRPSLRHAADRHRALIGRTNSFLILFIVFAAFANAVQDGVWAGQGLSTVILTAAGAATLLAAASVLVLGCAHLAGLDPADRIAAFYCGSQKTVAAGVPMAQSIFAGSPFAVGIVILPIMFYHLLQLTLGVILTAKFRRTMAPTPQAPT